MENQLNPDYCMNGTITLDEFKACIMRGESRPRPGLGVGYVILLDDDEEVFYAEWPYSNDDNMDVQDDLMAEFAYRAYREGCDEFIASI